MNIAKYDLLPPPDIASIQSFMIVENNASEIDALVMTEIPVMSLRTSFYLPLFRNEYLLNQEEDITEMIGELTDDMRELKRYYRQANDYPLEYRYRKIVGSLDLYYGSPEIREHELIVAATNSVIEAAVKRMR